MYRLTKSRRFFNDKKRRAAGSQQAGVTLIEVLVSILVLSVGLLGMMGLQAGAMRFEHGAWVRSAVSAAVADFSDGIRMIPNWVTVCVKIVGGSGVEKCTKEKVQEQFASIRSYADELKATENAAYFVTNPNCDSTNCTYKEFVSFQRASWRRGINANFPGGVGFIQRSGAEGLSQTYTLIVAWADKSLVDSDGTPSAATVCSGDEIGVAARNCCPTEISAPAGVRCTSVVVLP